MSDNAAPVSVWPLLRTWSTDEHVSDPDALLEQLGRFAPADGPPNNLGPQNGTVWLHAAWQVSADSDGQWLLNLRNPQLEDVRVYIYQDGRRIGQHQLGTAQPVDARPLPTRAHAVPLALQPGTRADILAAVSTRGPHLVPFSLEKPSTLLRTEGRSHLLYGVLFGLAFALLAWSMALAFSARDRLFFWHAVLVASAVGLLACESGVGSLYLWGRAEGTSVKLGTAFMLSLTASAAAFLRHAMAMRKSEPLSDGALLALSIVAWTGLLMTPMSTVAPQDLERLAGVVGPLTVFLGLIAALRGWRRGEPAAAATLAGWALFLVGMLTAASIARGWMAAYAWTMNLLHGSVALALAAWTPVLVHRASRLRRIGRLRHAAEAAKADHQRLGTQARVDGLTGLADRRGLSAALLQALSRRATQAPKSLVGVYLIDLDGFESINETHGHQVGDALLVEVATRLVSQVRGRDVVARLSGDEFVVVIANQQDNADVHAFGHKLMTVFAQPFDVAGTKHVTRATIGYSVAPEHGEDASLLLRRADLAMTEGKQGDGAQLVRFDPRALQSRRDTVPFDVQVQRVETTGELRRALETLPSE